MKISSEKAMQTGCVLKNVGRRKAENGKREDPAFSDMIVRILSMFFRPQGESLSSDQASAGETRGDGDPLLGSAGLSEMARRTDPQVFQTGLYSAAVQVRGPLTDADLQSMGGQEAVSAGIQQTDAEQDGAGPLDAGTQSAGTQSTGTSESLLKDIRLQGGGIPGNLVLDAGLQSTEVQGAIPAGIQQMEVGQEDTGTNNGKQGTGISGTPASNVRMQGAEVREVGSGPSPNAGLQSAEVQETDGNLSPNAVLHSAWVRETGSSPDTGITAAGAQKTVPADARQAGQGGTGSAGIRIQGASVSDGRDVGSVPLSDVSAASGPDVQKDDSGGISPGDTENVGLPDPSVPGMELAKKTARQVPSLPMGNPVWKEDLSASAPAASKNALEKDISKKMDGKAGQTGNFLKGPEVSRTSFHPAIRNLEDIASRMTERVAMNRQENLSGLKVRLSPRELGEIEIQVHMKDGHLAGTILVENTAAAEALEKQLPDLTSRLKEQNVRLHDVNISLQQNDADRGQGGGNPFYRENRPVRRCFREGIWKEEPIRPETVSVSSRNAYPGWNTGLSLDRLI